MAPSVAITSPPSNGPVRIHPRPPSLQPPRYTSPTRPPGIIMYNNAIHVSNHSINERTLAAIKTDCITHIYYASARLRQDGTVYLDDIDISQPNGGARSRLGACARLRQRNNIIKIILSIGSGNHNDNECFRAIAADEQARLKCASSARHIVDSFKLDGIDVVWENITNDADASNYILLLSYMRDTLPQEQYIVSASVSYNRFIDFGPASFYVDLINLKCFDFAGPTWSSVVGHASPTYSTIGSSSANTGLSCVSAIENLTLKGVPGNKIMLGVPAYGWSFLSASRIGEDYSSKRGQGRKIPYSELLNKPGLGPEYDNDAKACYTRGDHGGLVTFDSPWSIQAKAELVKENSLAGLAFWEATSDHSDHAKSIVFAGWQHLLPAGVRE